MTAELKKMNDDDAETMKSLQKLNDDTLTSLKNMTEERGPSERGPHQPRLLDDDAHSLLIEQVESGKKISLPHKRTNAQRQVYHYRRTHSLEIREMHNEVTGTKERRLCLHYKNAWLVLPRVGEVEGILKHYYQVHKGEGARKLVNRIQETFVGIPRERITLFLRNQEDYTPQQRQPGPAKPRYVKKLAAIKREVHALHQIDIVSFESSPQIRDGVVYCQVLSVLDTFSKYLWLYPLASRSPQEVFKHLLGLYRIFGPPKRIQSDQELDFFGDFTTLLGKIGVEFVKSRPQPSQAKIERVQGAWGRKLQYDLMNCENNWYDQLQLYATKYNATPYPSLEDGPSPFYVYYGRNSNATDVTRLFKEELTAAVSSASATVIRNASQQQQQQTASTENILKRVPGDDVQSTSHMCGESSRSSLSHQDTPQFLKRPPVNCLPLFNHVQSTHGGPSSSQNTGNGVISDAKQSLAISNHHILNSISRQPSHSHHEASTGHSMNSHDSSDVVPTSIVQVQSSQSMENTFGNVFGNAIVGAVQEPKI